MQLPCHRVVSRALTVLGPYRCRAPAASTETKYAFNLTTAPEPQNQIMVLATESDTSDHICTTFNDPNRVVLMLSAPACRAAAAVVR